MAIDGGRVKGYSPLIEKKELNESIIIHTDQDYRGACKEALSFLRLKDQVKDRDKVVIKPNLVSLRPYADGAVTDPLVLDVVLESLREYYRGEIVIAEAQAHFRTESYHKTGVFSLDPEDLKQGFMLAMRNSGISEVLEKRSDPEIRLLDVSDTEYADPNDVKQRVAAKYGDIAKKISSMYLKMVPSEFLKGNILGINLAKFKSHDHRPTVVTLALKNLYGFTTPPNREHLHGHWHNPWRLVESIISMDLIYTSVFDQWLHIVDGLRFCMEGNGPSLGTLVESWGKIAAGTNPVELDAICARMMGQDPARLPYLKKASKKLESYNEALLSEIPSGFERKFKLNEQVLAWQEAEKRLSPSILYLKFAGFLWNTFPGFARLLSSLRRILGISPPNLRLKKSI
jgi:uncharacterized protein (DUF362 family)